VSIDDITKLNINGEITLKSILFSTVSIYAKNIYLENSKLLKVILF
jgi:hypothetical protein